MPDDARDGLLRSVVEELAAIPRLPTSTGERQAAHRVCNRLEGFRCRAVVEEVPAFSSYAWPVGVLSAIGAAAGYASLRGHRLIGVVGGSAAALGIIDDITGGSMICRRMFMRRRIAFNVVAETGDPRARRTLVLLAHHDAAPSGIVFHPAALEWLAAHRPELIAKMKSNPPTWWPVIAGPALVALGSTLRSRPLRWIGLGGALGSLAAMIDIGVRPAVPGANDNLSGVAAIVAVAKALVDTPLSGLRVLLVSAGAEEALQEGIRAFACRHFADLPTDETYFLNLDAVGSGRLVLLEGEGPVRMRDYNVDFKDFVASCAAVKGIPLLRGLRSRNSTDGAVPNSRGYPTATLVSVDDRKLIPHYHLNSDIPEHVDYACVNAAAQLSEAVARTLANSG